MPPVPDRFPMNSVNRRHIAASAKELAESLQKKYRNFYYNLEIQEQREYLLHMLSTIQHYAPLQNGGLPYDADKLTRMEVSHGDARIGDFLEGYYSVLDTFANWYISNLMYQLEEGDFNPGMLDNVNPGTLGSSTPVNFFNWLAEHYGLPLPRSTELTDDEDEDELVDEIGLTPEDSAAISAAIEASIAMDAEEDLYVDYSIAAAEAIYLNDSLIHCAFDGNFSRQIDWNPGILDQLAGSAGSPYLPNLLHHGECNYKKILANMRINNCQVVTDNSPHVLVCFKDGDGSNCHLDNLERRILKPSMLWKP